ncbi:ABC transporter permease [Peribacillus frigoritolerans]|uniref:ABC transporter permease n=1 Tax=Peribacillus frigoritolerans TaxID=450367 RepID=UPI00105967E9|nr:ABC transporter permease [Peribacillus frigoritolerans]TDL76083.1 ABC transporter permease [Peribacillus frigoritolerans]
MTFRRIAFHNVFRNKRLYIGHFLSSAFSVMIFFTFALLLFHPQLQGELASTSPAISALSKKGLAISQILIFVFSFLFLLYSVGSFLKMRNKEIGILMIHGLSPKQQIRMVFMENIVIGIISIAAGIAVGLVFSKLILLLSATMLAIEKGLDFYFPLKAIALTALVFMLLFLLISWFSSHLVKTKELVEQLKGEDKPKPEPRASKWLSVLAALLIASGYGLAFYFVIERKFEFPVLFLIIALSVTGTYFLFSQLSVYWIGALKEKRRFFFKKTNIITLSEMAYRMKDNATTFFMVAVISAVAFTGMGITSVLRDPGLTEQTNPFAFRYYSNPGDERKEEHLNLIEAELTQAGYSYRAGSYSTKYTENGLTVIRLSDYNSLLKTFGYPVETLDSDKQAIAIPTTYVQKRDFEEKKGLPTEIDVLAGEVDERLQIVKNVPHLVASDLGRAAIVMTDALYDRLPLQDGEGGEVRAFVFLVDNWPETKEVAKKLKEAIPLQNGAPFSFAEPLVLEWFKSKQQNGLILIISVLVGIVFFTFAASFLYLRLYTDLERDRAQYKMIAKVGLSRKELGRIVTLQLSFMFFVPLLMALIHSTVAFIALQQLVEYSVFKGGAAIFISFTLVQIVYFLVARWRYMNHMVNGQLEK